jgi:methyltransferase (TIGR00027 family)
MFGDTPSRTAEVVCLMRAYEHTKPASRRIVDDPYARWFLRPVARAALANRGTSRRLERYAGWANDGLVRFLVAHHRYIDDTLTRALRGRVEQVVILGGGYDTRAYRFAPALRGRPVYEVDHSATSARKVKHESSGSTPASCRHKRPARHGRFPDRVIP